MDRSSPQTRTETDSLGDVTVSKSALYGAQTQRAIDNFAISGLVMPRHFIFALGTLKHACAHANHQLGLLPEAVSRGIQKAALEVANGEHDDAFPIDVFQTGSGTSTNMNANEVIATLASRYVGMAIHPNDHVNMSQSSNDVIPSCIHISAVVQLNTRLLPALAYLSKVIKDKGQALDHIVKTGRTHLMDAMPLTLGQELSGWAAQLDQGYQRINDSLSRLAELAIGGTAVGTGINAPNGYRNKVIEQLNQTTGQQFRTKSNYFEALSSQDAAVEMSGQLKTLAVSITKICNDLRWMGSGPLSGLAEINLAALQPGSSIMPGKTNPVLPEATLMACAQVIGNDTTITIAGQSGNFQLNVMLPVIAYNLLQSIELLSSSMRLLADTTVAPFTVNEQRLTEALELNPILITALNQHIGYDQGAKIAKLALEHRRPIIDVVREMTDLDPDQIASLLDPKNLTR